MTPAEARILALRHLAGAAVAAAADASPFIWRDEAGNLRSAEDRRLLKGALLVEGSTLEDMARAALAEEHERPTLRDTERPPEPACFTFDLTEEELAEDDRPAILSPPPRTLDAALAAAAGAFTPPGGGR